MGTFQWETALRRSSILLGHVVILFLGVFKDSIFSAFVCLLHKVSHVTCALLDALSFGPSLSNRHFVFGREKHAQDF